MCIYIYIYIYIYMLMYLCIAVSNNTHSIYANFFSEHANERFHYVECHSVKKNENILIVL